MDTVVAALVGGLLGGAAMGAVVGGMFTLLSQRRAFEHERAARFLDVKRERYANFLRSAEEWTHFEGLRHDYVEDGGSDAVPELPSVQPLQVLADEIELLGSDPVVKASSEVMGAILMLVGLDKSIPVKSRLSPFTPEATQLLRERVPHKEVAHQYTLCRTRFVAAVRDELRAG